MASCSLQKRRAISSVLGVLVFGLLAAIANGEGSSYASLKQDLLKDYDPEARPGSPEAPIAVKMGLMVNSVQLEEYANVLHVDAFALIVWQDGRLKWDPASYSGISSLRLPANSVWIPDVVLENEVPNFATSVQAEQKMVLMFSNGTVLWVPSVTLRSACAFDLRSFPRDIQKCTMTFGSWTYDKAEIDVKLAEKPLNLDYYIPTSQWSIIESSAEEKDVVYPDIEGVYPALIFSFSLQRRLGLYCLTVYLPILVSLMASAASWLVSRKQTSGAELIIGSLLNAGIMIMSMIYVGAHLGASANGAPTILQFMGALVALEAMLLPLKAMHAVFLKGVKAPNGNEIKPLPQLASAFVNFNFFWNGQGGTNDDKIVETADSCDKSALLMASELRSERNYNEWLRVGSCVWLTLASAHVLGVTLALTLFFPPL